MACTCRHVAEVFEDQVHEGLIRLDDYVDLSETLPLRIIYNDCNTCSKTKFQDFPLLLLPTLTLHDTPAFGS